MPKRIQRRRTKGWRQPPGAICVDRSTPYGNPFRAGTRFYVAGAIGPAEWLDNSPLGCVKAFEHWVLSHQDYWVPLIRNLIGHDLACWCRLCPEHAAGKPLGVKCSACAPCHADVLLDFANA